MLLLAETKMGRCAPPTLMLLTLLCTGHMQIREQALDTGSSSLSLVVTNSIFLDQSGSAVFADERSDWQGSLTVSPALPACSTSSSESALCHSWR